jgi:hypothetical protein
MRSQEGDRAQSLFGLHEHWGFVPNTVSMVYSITESWKKPLLYLNHKVVVIGDIQNLQQMNPCFRAFSFTSLPQYSPAKNQSFSSLS